MPGTGKRLKTSLSSPKVYLHWEKELIEKSNKLKKICPSFESKGVPALRKGTYLKK